MDEAWAGQTSLTMEEKIKHFKYHKTYLTGEGDHACWGLKRHSSVVDERLGELNGEEEKQTCTTVRFREALGI